MNKLSSHNLLVAAVLFGIAADSAWAQETTPGTPAAPAEQAASPGTGHAPYWQPPRWHEPPPPPPQPGYYGHYPPYYPPYPQYRATPAENPLSAELQKAQQQLAERSAELNTANEQLARLQAEQQAIREVMQQAQAETAKASEQLSVVTEEMDILHEVLSELKARLDVQNTSLQGAVQAGANENDEGDSTVAGDAEQAPSPAATSARPEDAGSEQTEAGDNEAAKPEAM